MPHFFNFAGDACNGLRWSVILLDASKSHKAGLSTTTDKRQVKAGSHRKDYERIKLKTDLRLVKITKSEGKPFHICLKNMFSSNFVELLFKINNFPLS